MNSFSFLTDQFYCSTRGNTWSTWPTSDSVPLYDQHFEQRQQQRSKTSRGRLCVGQMAHHVPTIHPVCPVWIFRNIVVLGTKKGQGGKGSAQKCGGETYWQQWWHWLHNWWQWWWPGIRESGDLPSWSPPHRRSPRSRCILHYPLCWRLWEDRHEDHDLRDSAARGELPFMASSWTVNLPKF